MAEPQPFVQHEGKVIDPDRKFKHVMALTLDPTKQNREGILRCIVNRTGDVQVHGYIDQSKLYKIKGDSLERFEITEPLMLRGQDSLIESLGGEEWNFIGLEDPDIWIDGRTGLMHLYFTIALLAKDTEKRPNNISLGHAVGKNIDSLVMTEPVLKAIAHNKERHHAKEVSIAPVNRDGVRFNLFESSDHVGRVSYSTVRVAIAKDMGMPWEYGETVFHPAEHHITWIAEHASPGPLLPRSFIDLGPDKLLGVMNGREASVREGDKVYYKTFSIGLFIYDYERGKIEWVSPEPLIRDTEAKTITFASQFVETGPGEGILYAHVDDSFVRAYTLYAEGIRALLP